VQVGVAVSVTLVAGLFQLVMRVFGLGIICSFMSMPFIVAFLTASCTLGIVLQVISLSNWPKLCTCLHKHKSHTEHIFHIVEELTVPWEEFKRIDIGDVDFSVEWDELKLDFIRQLHFVDSVQSTHSLYNNNTSCKLTHQYADNSKPRNGGKMLM